VPSSTFPFYRGSADQARQIDTLNPELPQANVGLWFTRFYDGFDPAWEIDARSKGDFIKATAALSDKQDKASTERLKAFAVRQKTLCEALGGQCVTLTTDGPLVTGTGLSHPVENGFTFHPTTGMPYLPASGVKGLLRGWTEVWAGLSDDERRARVALWFGAVKDKDGQGQDEAGALVFFDAVPADRVTLGCDVLTPHMGGWYEQGDRLSERNFASVAPGDWHSPVPSPFLVLEKGAKLQFGIAPRLTGEAAHDAHARAAVGLALAALKAALEWIGAGAKTAAGYGRLVDVASRQAEEHKQALAEAGISAGQVEWPAADVAWNKGKVELTVRSPDGGRSVKTQQPARDLRSQLSAADQKKLDSGKTVKAHATVEQQGNNYTLQSLRSLG
jgi:CRISPR-associated protein Cmr6